MKEGTDRKEKEGRGNCANGRNKFRISKKHVKIKKVRKLKEKEEKKKGK